MVSRKQAHLSTEIQQKLGALLSRGVNDPRLATVTITAVNLSKDRSSARVHFCNYAGETDSVELTRILNGAAGYLGKMLAGSLRVRRTPRLYFYYDSGFEEVARIDQVLNDLKKDREP